MTYLAERLEVDEDTLRHHYERTVATYRGTIGDAIFVTTGYRAVSGKDLHVLIEHQWPHTPGVSRHHVEEVVPQCYHSSWTQYWFVRDVFRACGRRPRCLVCGARPGRFRVFNPRDWIDVRSPGRLVLAPTKGVVCSPECWEEWLLREEQRLRHHAQEGEWLREGKALLREVRRLLRAGSSLRVSKLRTKGSRPPATSGT